MIEQGQPEELNEFDPNAMLGFIKLRLRALYANKQLGCDEMINFKPTDFQVVRSAFADELIYQLRAYAIQERLSTLKIPITFYYPKTWWQHFKKSCFPHWLRRRFPVENASETATVVCQLNATLIEKAQEYLERAQSVRGASVLQFDCTQISKSTDWIDDE